MGQFEHTTEGYVLAKAWLIDIGREDILTGGFSTDGWSVVEAANTIWSNKNRSGLTPVSGVDEEPSITCQEK